jgi:hypothetical protein
MGTDPSWVVVIAILFLCTFLSGFGLSHFQRPYNVALLTVHKLLALGAMVLIGVLVVKGYRVAGLSRLEWAGWLTAGFVLLIAFGSGAFLTALKPPHAALIAHRIAPYFGATLTTAALCISFLKTR